MVLIPAGPFVMGDAFKEVDKELPLHTNQLSAFFMDQYDVNLEKWTTVYHWATNNGYTFDGSADGKSNQHPVESVNWQGGFKQARKEPRALKKSIKKWTNASISILIGACQRRLRCPESKIQPF
jgi:formylglycine-generating enzyme required for sulfatase activity